MPHLRFLSQAAHSAHATLSAHFCRTVGFQMSQATHREKLKAGLRNPASPRPQQLSNLLLLLVIHTSSSCTGRSSHPENRKAVHLSVDKTKKSRAELMGPHGYTIPLQLPEPRALRFRNVTISLVSLGNLACVKLDF